MSYQPSIETMIAARKGMPPAGPNGIPADLGQVLKVQAAVKAKQDADAALAAVMGQQAGQQPTVVQGLMRQAQVMQQAPKSPREVATQNMGQGLPGALAARAAPPGQAPQPAPGQPPVGVAGLSSNLPPSYAGGGIIAFDQGDYVEKPNRNHGESRQDEMYEGISIADAQKRAEAEVAANAALAAHAAKKAQATPKVAAQVPDAGIKALASSKQRSSQSVSTPSGMGEPTQSASELSMENLATKGIERLNAVDPEAMAAAAEQRHLATLGPAQAAYREAQQQGVDATRAAQEAQLAAAKPNFATWLSSFNPNARFFGEGVADKMQAKQDAYHKMQAEHVAGLRGLQEAKAKATLADITGQLGANEAGRTAGMGAQEKGTVLATQAMDVNSKAFSARLQAWESMKARLAQAAQANTARGDARAVAEDAKWAAIMENAQKNALSAAKDLAEGEAKQLANLGKPVDTGARAAMLAKTTLEADKAYQMALRHLQGKGYTAPTAEPAALIPPSRASQFKVIRP